MWQWLSKKKGIDLRGILFLMLSTLPLIAAVNIDCNGRPFHCVNSTHFMICVDIGGGLSSTMDDFLLPCPEPTICDQSNLFECEFPPEKPSTQLESFYTTDATPFESYSTTDPTFGIISTILDTTWSEATINTLRPTTPNDFQNASKIDPGVTISAIDSNNNTVLYQETSTEPFTKEITNNLSPTSNVLNVTDTIMTDATIIADSMSSTDLPSMITTDAQIKPIITTISPTTYSDNLHTLNTSINVSESIITTDSKLTSTLSPEIATEEMFSGITSIIHPTSSDFINITSATLNDMNVSTDSIISTDSPFTITTDVPITSTLSPTSYSDSLHISHTNNGEHIVTTDPKYTLVSTPVTSSDTSTLPPETANEALIKGITSTARPTSSDGVHTSNTNIDESTVTIDLNDTSAIPPETTNEVLIKETTSTAYPTSSNGVHTSNTNIGEPTVTIDSNDTSAIPPETTNEVLIKETASTAYPTSSNGVHTSNTNIGEPTVTIDSNDTSAIPPETTNEVLIKETASTVYPTSSDGVHTSNTNIDESTVTIDSNDTSAIPPETTNEVLIKETASTAYPTSSDGVHTSNTNIDESTVTIDSNDTLAIPPETTNEVLIKETASTAYPTSSNGVHTSNTNIGEPTVTIDSNVNSAIPPETTNEVLIKETASTVYPTSSDGVHTSNTNIDESTVTIDSNDTSKIPPETTNEVLIKETASTAYPTSSNGVHISNTNIGEPTVTIDSNDTSKIPPETTNEVLIKETASTAYPTSSNGVHISNTNIGEPTVTIDSNDTSAIPPETTNEVLIKETASTAYPTSSDGVHTSNTNIDESTVTIDSNDTSAIPPETTNEVLIKETASTAYPTFSNGVHTSNTNIGESIVTIDSNDTSAIPPETTNEVLIKETTSTAYPTSSNGVHTSNTNIGKPTVTIDSNDTSAIPPETANEVLIKGVTDTVGPTSNDVLNISVVTAYDRKVTTDSIYDTGLPASIGNDAWEKPIISTFSPMTPTDGVHTSNTDIGEPTVTIDSNDTSTMPSKTIDEVLIKGVTDTVGPTSNDVLNISVVTANDRKVTTDSIYDTGLPASIRNDAWEKPIISTFSPMTSSDVVHTSNMDVGEPTVIINSNDTSTLPSKTTSEVFIKAITNTAHPTSSDDIHTSNMNIVEPTVTINSNDSTALLSERTTDIFSKDITRNVGPESNDVSNITGAIVNDSKETTNSIIVTDSPLTIINNPWIKPTISTLSITSSDTLHSSNMNTVEPKVTADSNLPSVTFTEVLFKSPINVSNKMHKRVLYLPKFDDGGLNKSIIKTKRTAVNYPTSPTETVSNLTKAENAHISNSTSMALISENALAREDERKVTNSEKEISTKIHHFTNNFTKSLFTIKPEAVTTIYRESLADSKLPQSADNSRKVSSVIQHSDFITTTSAYRDTFTHKNQDNINSTESIINDILTSSNMLKQYSTETILTTDVRKAVVDPDPAKMMSKSSAITQHTTSVEKKTESTDKIPIPSYLPLMLQRNNQPNNIAISDSEYPNYSNTKDNVSANLKSSFALVYDINYRYSTNASSVTTNKPLKLITKYQISASSLNMTTSSFSYIGDRNKNSSIHDLINADYTLHDNIGNINVATNYHTENIRNMNSALRSKKWNSSVNTHDSYYVNMTSTNSVNFACLNHKRGRYADSKDCRKFYICIGRPQPIFAGTCPVNTVFSDVWRQCTKNLSHCVRNNQFRCISEGRFTDILQHNIFYICIKSNLNYFYRIKLQCQKGYYLNKTTIKCTLSTDEGSQSTSMDTDSSSKANDSDSNTTVTDDSGKSMNLEFECKDEGVFADPNDCRIYYICTKNKSQYRRKKKKCDSDEVFHREKKKCVDSDSYEC